MILGNSIFRRRPDYINAWGKFNDTELERAYGDSLVLETKARTARLILYAGLIFLVFFLLDYEAPPQDIAHSIAARTVDLLVCVIISRVIKRVNSYTLLDICIVIALLTIMLTYSYMIIALDYQDYPYQVSAIMLMMIFTSVFHIQWTRFSIMNTLAALAFIAASFFTLHSKDKIDYVQSVSYLVLAIVFLSWFKRTSNISKREKYVQQKELERMSVTDKLTGLNNRTWYSYRVKELTENNKAKHMIAAILFDIDNFKTINDTYGHEVGDETLIEFAALLRECLRMDDGIIRWGGEEFLLLMPDTPSTTIATIAERVRSEVEAHTFATIGTLTCSVGFVNAPAHMGVDALVKIADEMMYKAKRSGKNNVVAYEGTPEHFADL